MRLQSIKYAEWEGTPQEWRIDGLTLASANLIVGKNAAGKSRALRVILALAQHVAGLRAIPRSGHFDAEFLHDDQPIHYQLHYEDGQVIMERYIVAGESLLDRGADGVGTIVAEDIEGERKSIRFQTPSSEIAAVARRDTIQHSFLEPLYAWGAALRYYAFGTSLGQDQLAVFVEHGKRDIDTRDPQGVVALYRQVEKEFPQTFQQAVIHDMHQLDYDIEKLGTQPPISVRIRGDFPSEPTGLYVKERYLPGITDQPSMSQGMFRVLSLLIQVNYAQMAKQATCILIDDIGEGLDFDRSCRLIDLLRAKAKAADIQLVLASNDRFVMNRVPLEEWSVLQRRGSHVQVLNYANSRELFEEFKFTGLSNFSFLEMDFASGPPVEETAPYA